MTTKQKNAYITLNRHNLSEAFIDIYANWIAEGREEYVAKCLLQSGKSEGVVAVILYALNNLVD